jgi:hypothetical protein
MRWANAATVGMAAIVAVAIAAYNAAGVKEMSDRSAQAYLRLYGESIYEYHGLTGRWPAQANDLAATSLPQRNPHWWKAQLDAGADVIVWPKHLDPDPAHNGQTILCYHAKGLDAERGRMWVCWGDLRTGCMTPEELRANLDHR